MTAYPREERAIARRFGLSAHQLHVLLRIARGDGISGNNTGPVLDRLGYTEGIGYERRATSAGRLVIARARMLGYGVLLVLLGLPIAASARLGTVTPDDAALSCAEARQLADENRALLARAYGERGQVVDPVASELLSWRLLHGPALKPPCQDGER